MKKSVAALLAVLVVAIWGITFTSTKILIGAGLHPSWIFAMRFILAYLGIWVLCLRNESSRMIFAPSLRDELILVFLGITGGSFYFLFENTALAYTQACNVSFIVCSAPLITALLTLFVKRFFKGELVDGLEDVSGRWQLLVGTVLALAGMAAVIFDGNAVEFSAKGDLLALGAAICWGFYGIFMSQMTAKYGALAATRKVFFYGLVTIIPFLLGEDIDITVLAIPKVWGNLLFLALLASLGCFVLWNKVMAVLGNVTSSNFIYLNPLFTLVSAIIILGERLTVQSGIGCAAILLGVIIAGLKKT